MAYALVGSAGSVASGTASVSPSFGQATTAANLLIGWITSYGSGGAITTTASGWTVAHDPGTASGLRGAIWYKANCGASETAPTFTSSGATGMFAALAEFSGGATSSPIDQHTDSGFGTGSPTVTLPGADAAAGELFVTGHALLLSKAGTNTSTDSYNNGATPTTNLNNDATSTANHYTFAWGVTTSNTGADSDTTTDSSMNITIGTVVIVSFLLASAAAATIPDVGLALTVT